MGTAGASAALGGNQWRCRKATEIVAEHVLNKKEYTAGQLAGELVESAVTSGLMAGGAYGAGQVGSAVLKNTVAGQKVNQMVANSRLGQLTRAGANKKRCLSPVIGKNN